MHVTIDADRCGGHGFCCDLCPEVFELTDDGYAVAKHGTVPVHFEQAVRTAVQQCPERAISTS